jgi:drug/metabolite transporter (DMT)-like permease
MHATSERCWTPLLTALALVAFAANSVLCRLALGQATVDAASFSAIRLVSGAAALLLITALFRGASASQQRGSWTSATMLVLYAVAFSFAYVSLTAGTGALILFAAVQTTMVLAALRSGERPRLFEWVGLVIALAGLVYLVFPGLSAPSPRGSALMAVAGISWGVYTLRGRSAVDPVAATTDNFVRSVPLVLGLGLIMLRDVQVSPQGALLAVVSGSLASGVGYVIWYAALRGLTATRAAAVQLPVPALAAVGGVIFLSEEMSIRLFVSTVAILGGLGLVLVGSTGTAGTAALRLKLRLSPTASLVLGRTGWVHDPASTAPLSPDHGPLRRPGRWPEGVV